MRRRDLALLGVRLGWHAGRGARLRTIVLVVATALAWVIVLVAAAIPAMAQVRTDRAAARSINDQPHQNAPKFRLLESQDVWRGQVVELVFVAAPAGTPGPPGMAELPTVGHSVVSPTLAATLKKPDAAGLRARLGHVDGVISPAGLVEPSELRAYIGTTPAAIGRTATSRETPSRIGLATGFGASPRDVSAETLQWSLGLLVVLLAPIVTLLVACLRLTATTRDRQLAALRLLGLSAQETTRVLAGVLLVPLLIGAVAGTTLFEIGARLLGSRPLAGRTFYPADLHLSLPSLCLAASALWLFVALARHRSLAAINSPLEVRRDRAPKRTRRWVLVPLAGGLTLFAAVLALSSSQIINDELDVGTNLFLCHLAATALSAAGLLLAAPLLGDRIGDLVGTRGRSVGAHLAGRTLQHDPAAAARLCASISCAVLVGTLGLSFLSAVSNSAQYSMQAPPRTAVISRITSADLLPRLRAAFGARNVAPLWRLDAYPGAGPWGAVVADCVLLTSFDPALHGCHRGTMSYYLYAASDLTGRTTPPPDSSITGGERPLGRPHGNSQAFGGIAAGVLVEPTAPALRGQDLGPPTRLIVRASSDADYSRVSSIVATTDPLAQVRTARSDRATYRSLHPIDDRATALLLWAVCAVLFLTLVITAVDRVAARQSTDIRLQALGTPRRQMQLAAALSLALPALAVFPIAAVGAIGSDLAWDRVIHQPMHVTNQTWWLICAAPTLIVTVAALLTLLTTSPHQHPEALRRE